MRQRRRACQVAPATLRQLDAQSSADARCSERATTEGCLDDGRNARYARGLRNVIRLVSVTILLTATTMASYFLAYADYLNMNVHMLFSFYDASNFLWLSKMAVIGVSDVKVRRAVKKRLIKLQCWKGRL